MEFRKVLSYPENRAYWEILNIVDQVVPSESVKAFYPLNLYSSKEGLTLFLFTEKDIWIAEQSGWSVDITVHKNYQVDTVNKQFHLRNRSEGIELNLSLRSEETLEFNSKDDAPNEDWIDAFSGYIDEIFNLMVQAP